MFTHSQYVSARIYQIFKMMVSDRNKPPTPAEALLYEACFAYLDNNNGPKGT